MLLEIMKSKIHRVTVTQADLNYIGSITIDTDLMKAVSTSSTITTANVLTLTPYRVRQDLA